MSKNAGFTRARYRVVLDDGIWKVQIRYPWWPIWIRILDGGYCFLKLEDAEEMALWHAQRASRVNCRIVELGRLPRT